MVTISTGLLLKRQQQKKEHAKSLSRQQERQNTIQLPSSLQEIRNYAFLDCDHIKTIFVPQSMGTIHSTVFIGCRSISAFHLPQLTEAKFTATEQKLITELCRTDGKSAMDRFRMGWG